MLFRSEYGLEIQEFQLVFEAGIRYFPKKNGIRFLFQKSKYSGTTPFKMACKQFGRDKVMKMIETTLIDCCPAGDNNAYDAPQALLSAAVDPIIHLDCVHFVLRREPDVLSKLLSSPEARSTAATAAARGSSRDSGSAAADGRGGGNNNNNGSGKRKRKRKRQA